MRAKGAHDCDQALVSALQRLAGERAFSSTCIHSAASSNASLSPHVLEISEMLLSRLTRQCRELADKTR